MGLIISELKIKSHTYENAYAKINNINYDNNLKTAMFDVTIFKNKDSRTLMRTIVELSTPIIGSLNIISQCYEAIPKLINNLQKLQEEVESQLIEDSTNKTLLAELKRIKSNVLYLLLTAKSDE